MYFDIKKNYLIKLFSFLILACFSVFINAVNLNIYAATQKKDLPVVEKTKLISILVEADLFEALESKIKRFARDTQKAIGGKSIIVPVKKTISPFEIFEGNAALYFSGENNDQKSELVGTIILGEVPLPVLEKENQIFASVYPYTDFENSMYKWDYTKNVFLEKKGVGDSSPEIWHGIIASDFSQEKTLEANEKIRTKEIEDYLDRNHLFHSGQLSFSDRIFSVDFFRQQDGIPAPLKQNYDLYIKNIEDILYNRFTKEKAAAVFGQQNFEALIPKKYRKTNALDFSVVPDVLSKQILEQMLKRYYEYYEGYLRSNNTLVENAGRWNPQQIETTISLVSQKDEVVAETLKQFNDEIETLLDTEAQQFLAEDIIL